MPEVRPAVQRQDVGPPETSDGKAEAMVFMVIEHFPSGMASEAYRRFRHRGRMAPGNDLVEFEIVQVRTSERAAAAI